MKMASKFFMTSYKSWARVNLGLAVLVAIITNFGQHLYDFFLGPRFDYVYTVEKTPNPLNASREEMNSIIKALIALEKQKYFVSPSDENSLRDGMQSVFTASINAQKEIDADQVRVWIINLNRYTLDKVNIVFQGCDGYIKHEVTPIALNQGEIGTTNPTISPNGVLYRYGMIRPEGEASLKFGFEKIADCTVLIDALRSDGKATHGKWVTGEDWWQYKNQLRQGREKYFQIAIGGLGLIVAILVIWGGVAKTSIDRRVATLEKQDIELQDAKTKGGS